MSAIVDHGAALARFNGVTNPTPEDGAWELLIEAADTLRRLPDRERAWLVSAERCAWPPMLKEQAERWAEAVNAGGWRDFQDPRPGPPEKAAIDRMDVVLAALTGLDRPLDGRRAFLLAARVPARVIAVKTACSRLTVYRARDRATALLARGLVTPKNRGLHLKQKTASFPP
jgi:hypothetical protein